MKSITQTNIEQQNQVSYLKKNLLESMDPIEYNQPSINNKRELAKIYMQPKM